MKRPRKRRSPHLAGRRRSASRRRSRGSGPVHGRARVGLGEHEQVRLARERAHLRRQLREAARAGAARPCRAACRGRCPATAREHSSPPSRAELVLAVAEEGEVVVAIQCRNARASASSLLADRRAALLELGDQLGAPRRASPASPRPPRARRRARARGRRGAARARRDRSGGRPRRGSATRALPVRRAPTSSSRPSASRRDGA